MLKKVMDELFKQNLLRLRKNPGPTNFGQALYPNSYWNPKLHERPVTLKSLVQEEFSEKRQVLESFERFANEKVEEIASSVFKVEGGEVAIRPEPTWESGQLFENIVELKSSLSIPSEYLQILFNNKSRGKVKVIFVTENFRSPEVVRPEFKEGFINELLTGFPIKTAELFERMIGAMKLTAEEVFLYPVEWEGRDMTQEVIQIASFLAPEVIITLGARAAQKILKSNDRLSLIHGQFFKRSVEGVNSFQVVPLFHPSIIETNQNMKKTAWADMQKIMQSLKKLT